MNVYFSKEEIEKKGKIVLYKNCIKVGTDEFSYLDKAISKEHKIKQTDVFSNSVHLFFTIKDDEIILKEERRLDLVRFAQNAREYFKLIKDYFSEEK